MADRNVEALTDPLYIGNGANRIKVSLDGTLTTEGTATTWNDVRTDLFGARLSVNRGRVDYNYDEGSITLQDNGDIDNNDDVVQGSFQMPHDAKEDSLFKFHIHWWQTDNTSREFTVSYRVQPNGSAKTVPWTPIVVTADATTNAFTYTSGTLNQITALFNLDTTGFGLSSLIQFKLTKSDNNGDVDATFLDAHYEIDSLGSAEEYVK